MRTVARKALSLSLAVLIVSAVLGGAAFTPSPAVGTADAASVTGCVSEIAQQSLGAVTGVQLTTAEQTADACYEHGTSEDAINNLSATQGYTQALGVSDSSSSFRTMFANRLDGTRSLASMQAKITAVNELNNGTTRSVVKDRVNQTVEDFYANIQRNFLKKWEAYINQLRYVKTGTTAGLRYAESASGLSINGNYSSDLTWVRQNVTLENGTVMSGVWFPAIKETVLTVVAAIPSSYLSDDNRYENHDTLYYSVPRGSRLEAKDPDTGNWNRVLHMNGSSTSIYHLWERIVSQVPDVKSNVNTIVENVYSKYRAGELNTTDLLSPITLAYRAGTSWNSTGSQQFAAIQLATLGYSGNINATATVTTNLSTATYTGTLFYTGDDLPNGSLVAGNTYDTANLNGTFVMAVQGNNGNTWVEEWKHAKVTIQGLRDASSGESINKTEVHEYTSRSANVSKLDTRIQRLVNLTKKYRRLAKQDGTSSGISLSKNQKIIGGLLFLALLGAIYARDGSDGNGGVTLIDSGRRRGGN